MAESIHKCFREIHPEGYEQMWADLDGQDLSDYAIFLINKIWFDSTLTTFDRDELFIDLVNLDSVSYDDEIMNFHAWTTPDD